MARSALEGAVAAKADLLHATSDAARIELDKKVKTMSAIAEEAEQLADRVGVIHKGKIILVEDREALMKRSCIAPMGTLMTAQLALQQGIACHLAGGTHHAHYDFGSGFCIFNDQAFAVRQLLDRGVVKKALMFDCDVHQGDGTAAMLADETRAFTCSIHCEKNFPVRKMKSDLDVGLPLGMTDKDYLDTVFETLDQLLDLVQPDLVFYDAGVDIFQHDPLGRLHITEQGIADRDRGVLARCRQRNVPVATVIGGGYDDDRDALAQRHAIVVEAASEVHSFL